MSLKHASNYSYGQIWPEGHAPIGIYHFKKCVYVFNYSSYPNFVRFYQILNKIIQLFNLVTFITVYLCLLSSNSSYISI